MIKKDLESYKVHDVDYQSVFDLKRSLEIVKRYDELDTYAQNGFKAAVERIAGSIDTHIDIGTGTGWLLLKTAPFFSKVIGIEPSEHAVETAKEINKNSANVQFIEADMIDGLRRLEIEKPVFLTTAIVLSHIKDYYVREFLKEINVLPTGSVLYFHEPYDLNIQQRLWYIRSKEWWARNLSEWQLEFWDLAGEYKYGIFGRKVGRTEIKNTYRMRFYEKVGWFFNGLWNKVKRLGRAVKKIFNR
ncbi:MAG TPA: class I SAM-dependent methyltransferase [Candidatus Paceibacterota bacterium]|nr:class I SAM-dependent methyltransferase [Candidatus Paceibacterota bacterium]